MSDTRDAEYDWNAFRIKNGWPPLSPLTENYVASIVQRVDTVKRTPRWGACLRIKNAAFDPRTVLWWDIEDGRKIPLDDAELIVSCLRKCKNIGISFWRLSDAVAWLQGVHPPARHNEESR